MLSRVQGVAMLSSVLHSKRVIAVNIEVMRAFVRMRRLMAFEAEIRQRFEAIEHKAGELEADVGRPLLQAQLGADRIRGLEQPSSNWRFALMLVRPRAATIRPQPALLGDPVAATMLLP